MAGALGSIALGFCSGIGGAFTQIYGFAATISGFAFTVLMFVGEFVLELGGYAFAALGLTFTLFTGCFMRMTTEMLRPVTEWEGSEMKSVGCRYAFCACIGVVCLIFWVTVGAAFTLTLFWYELDEEVEQVIGGGE